jgi:two-component system sensor histidine kinase KdpD
LKLTLAPELPLVSLDPVLFEQVLFNLLDNAGKYATPGSPVEVAAEKVGGQVKVEIRDEGPGVPPEDLERIFDKFFRVHAADRQRAGTGLGLPISRGFVEAMGATIVARPRVNPSGTIFTITIPIEAA